MEGQSLRVKVDSPEKSRYKTTVLTLGPGKHCLCFLKYNALKQSICSSLSEFKNNKKTKSKKQTKPESIALSFVWLCIWRWGGPADLSNVGLILHGTLYSLRERLALSLQYTFTMKHLDDVQPSQSFNFKKKPGLGEPGFL